MLPNTSPVLGPCNHSLEIVEISEKFLTYLASSVNKCRHDLTDQTVDISDQHFSVTFQVHKWKENLETW